MTTAFASDADRNKYNYIVVDRGVKRCRAAIFGENGKVLGIGESGAANPVNVFEVATLSILSAINEVNAKPRLHSPLKQYLVDLGIARLHLLEIQVAIDKWQLPFAQLYAITDLEAVLVDAYDGGDGVVIIVGTGFLINALASASGLGFEVLESAFLDNDKVGPTTSMTQEVLATESILNLSGACTTSGAAYKMPGRVGDSPIIGASLYVDNEIGGATATGIGELMIETVSCHLVVELMRQGASPQQVCKQAVERIAKKLDGFEKFQVGFLPLNKRGEYGAYCIQPSFNYAVKNEHHEILLDASNLLEAAL